MNDAPVDLSDFRTISEGDPALERELISVFVVQADLCVQALKDNAVEGTHAVWKSNAHALKGSAGGVGAGELRHLCEQAQHASDDKAVRTALLSKIEQEYARVKDYFRSISLI